MASTEWDLIDSLSVGLAQEVSKADAKPTVTALAPAVNALGADLATQRQAGNTSDIRRLLVGARALWDSIDLNGVDANNRGAKLTVRIVDAANAPKEIAAANIKVKDRSSPANQPPAAPKPSEPKAPK